MCVICICSEEGKRPTEDQVRRMWNHNDHGGGVAWRENGKVHWRKGLTEPQMQEHIRLMPMPFIAHFRIASIGGKKAELTHPFVVPAPGEDHTKSLDLAGETTGSVLFHNGHWAGWDHELYAACQRAGVEVPRGPWSDSRAMAWMFKYYGLGFLDTLPSQRTVVITPDTLELGDFGNNGWTKKDAIWFSNMVWDYTASRWTICRFGRCNRADKLDTDGRCPLHPMKDDTQSPQLALADTRQITGPQGVDHTQGPFAVLEELAKAELAWGLVPQGFLSKEEARDVCPKNRLRNLRKQAAKIRGKAAKTTTLTH